MRYLILTFLTCCLVLPVLMHYQKEPANPYADGRLLAMPMTPPVRPPEPVPVEAQTVLPEPEAPAPKAAGARLQIVGNAAPAATAVIPRVRLSDPSDWGIPRLSEAAPAPVASVVEPQPVVLETTATLPAPTPTPATVAMAIPADPAFSEPNLYLPEGATNEAGALLTLIRHDLSVHELPDASSPSAPFKLKEGDQVRPLTRLRGETDFDWIKIARDGRHWWAQAEYFIRVDPRNRTTSGTGNLIIGQEVVDRTSALPPAYTPDDLIPVSREVTLEDREIRLRREAADAFFRMAEAALKDGVKIKVFSGYRDFNYQKKLYLEAIESKGPKQNGVAAPGYSEHQLGTTIDVSGLDRRYILRGSFAETTEGRWLATHAGRFGYRHSYTQENADESGFKPEPWHLRYTGAVQEAKRREATAQGQ